MSELARWRVAFEDKRGIQTIFAQDEPDQAEALRAAIRQMQQRHPEWSPAGEDYWCVGVRPVHRESAPQAAMEIGQ